MHPASVSSAVDPHVFLIGRPPIAEFLGYIATQTVEGQNADRGLLMDVWRAANDHILQLEASEAGLADHVAVGEVPPELQPLAARVLADPIVQRVYALAPIEIAMVELDNVVVYQKHINLAYVAELRELIDAAETPEELFGIALPFEQRNDPPVSVGRIAENSWVFKSPSSDFRSLGAELLDPSQVSGLNITGVPTAVLAIPVGYGSNYLSALRTEGRLVLNNGSHRAYALRDAGHTHVPCLIQQVSRRDELEVLVGQGHPLVVNADAYLKTARPPLAKDYFDERLRMVVHVARTGRQVQLSFGSSAADLPA